MDVDVTIRSTMDGSQEAGVFFRANSIEAGLDNYMGYYAFISPNGVKLVRNTGHNLIASANFTARVNYRYKLSVWAVSNRIRVYIDDALYLDVVDDTYTSGRVGLTAYNSTTQFDNILVTSEVAGAIRTSFGNNSHSAWTKYDGYYGMSALRFGIAPGSTGAKAILTGSDQVDNIIHCDMTLNGTQRAGLLFRVENPTAGTETYNGYYASISSSTIAIFRGPGFNVLGSVANSGHFNGKIYHLKVESIGSSIKFFVDGVLKVQVASTHWTKGRVGITAYGSEAYFDNFAISPNVTAGLAKKSASGTGYFGTPDYWRLITYNHGDFAPMLSDMASTFRDKFKNTNFGWTYTSENGNDNGFDYDNFTGSYPYIADANMVVTITHGNDGFFNDQNGYSVFLRGDKGAQQATFTKENRFLVLIGCSSLYTGVASPHNAKPYIPVMNGAHAILGYAAGFVFHANSNELKNLVNYFADKWHANKTTGIYPAFRDATFQALNYDAGTNLGAAPAVVFTVGKLLGERERERDEGRLLGLGGEDLEHLQWRDLHHFRRKGQIRI